VNVLSRVLAFVDQMAASQQADQEALEKQFFTKLGPSSLAQRFIQPEEVADLVALVCSPLSSG
jgi:NAD(P)-dependent dehydrogenase (short-subunit alcohol dehydrogenase family)